VTGVALRLASGEVGGVAPVRRILNGRLGDERVKTLRSRADDKSPKRTPQGPVFGIVTRVVPPTF
jgi:hypothetical protein